MELVATLSSFLTDFVSLKEKKISVKFCSICMRPIFRPFIRFTTMGAIIVIIIFVTGAAQKTAKK